jgi:SAM-dependent methyltransferase
VTADSAGPGGSARSRAAGPSSGQPGWVDLGDGYERARGREDSLDRLVEWPAQRDLIGDVAGRSVLDLGCGDGSKVRELVGAGAVDSIGVDIGGNFVRAEPGLQLVEGDLSDLDAIPALDGRTFDRIVLLQSFGYAADPVRTLQQAAARLTEDGFIVLTRTHPIRYAVERMEANGTSLGEEYYSTDDYSYRSSWNDQVTLTKRPYTIADLLNVFSAAGLWIETAVEPRLPEEAARKHPHKQAWLNTYLGILIFKLRPLTAARPRDSANSSRHAH